MQTKKRFIVVAGVAAMASLGLAGPSFAGNAGGGSGSGTPPGFSTASANSVCAGHGAFGAFGAGFNFGNPTSGHVPYPGNANNGNGADGQATGASNSQLCGNPQGNP